MSGHHWHGDADRFLRNSAKSSNDRTTTRASPAAVTAVPPTQFLPALCPGLAPPHGSDVDPLFGGETLECPAAQRLRRRLAVAGGVGRGEPAEVGKAPSVRDRSNGDLRRIRP